MLSWQTLRKTAPVLVFFTALAALTLYPLSLDIGGSVPGVPSGEWDYFHFHWNLWWVKYAVQHGQDFYTTNKVLAPFTHNLAYHSLTPVWLPVHALLDPLVGFPGSPNLIMWASITLTGALMMLFLRRHGVSAGVALLGGVALAYSPYMHEHNVGGHLNLLTVFWLPLILMIWEKTVSASARDRLLPLARWGLLAGVVLWAMWFTDTLIVFWGGLLLGPYALFALWQAVNRRARVRLLGAGILALVITVILAWLIGPLQPTLDFDNDMLQPARLLTLRAYALPVKLLVFPFFEGAQNTPGEGDEHLGRLLIVLVVAGILVRGKDHRQWFWLAASVLPLLLILGPDIDVFGTRVPLPFRVIHEVFGGQMRTPIRFTPPTLVPLITFVALVFDPVVRRLRLAHLRTALIAGLLLFLLWDYRVLLPLPTSAKLPDYELYHMMRDEHYDDYDYVVLEVPSGPFTGWRSIGSHPEAMIYGITHEKRMVSGLLSRIELHEHLFYENSYLLGWLTDFRALDAGRTISEINRFVDEWPIGYVVIHQDWDTPQRVLQYLEIFNSTPSLCYIGVERDAILYRTTSHPKGCPPRTPPETAPGEYTIKLGEPGDEGFIGHGWFWHEDIGGVTARWGGERVESLLYADVPPGSAYDLTVRAVAFAEPRRVKVVANGALLGYLDIVPGGWTDYTLSIPAEVVDQVAGKLILSLSSDGLLSAVDAGLSEDSRPLTLAVDRVQFRRADMEDAE
ncbi:MAG: hypothetical protein JW966_10710 [Anaerolineae bacterium]|nr:hypothetical protein [Anaerolineae bacterium]